MKNAAPHRQLRNHLMNPIRRVEGRVGVAGVDENDSRERQTDILQISRLHFLLLLIFYSHHDFPWNISPGFYGALTFSFFFPLPFCSLHVCFYWFGLWKHGLFIMDLKASIFLLCFHQGCDIVHKCCKSAQHPLSFSSLPVPWATLILIWAKHESVSRGRHDHNYFNLVVTFTYAPKPSFVVGMLVIFLAHWSQSLQKGSFIHREAPLASFDKSIPEKWEGLTFLQVKVLKKMPKG